MLVFVSPHGVFPFHPAAGDVIHIIDDEANAAVAHIHLKTADHDFLLASLDSEAFDLSLGQMKKGTIRGIADALTRSEADAEGVFFVAVGGLEFRLDDTEKGKN